MKESFGSPPVTRAQSGYYDATSQSTDPISDSMPIDTGMRLAQLRDGVERPKISFIRKDGLRFERWQGSSNHKQLEQFVQKNGVPIRVNNFQETVSGVTTAAMMVDDLMSDYDPQEQEWFKHYVIAQSSKESDHRYAVLGPIIKHKSAHRGHQALGRYQIMPKNWVAWSKEFFDGNVVKPTPQAMEYVTFRKYKQRYDYLKRKLGKGKSFDEYREEVFYVMACQWFSGRYKRLDIKMGIIDLDFTYAPNGKIDDYSQDVLKRMGFPETKRPNYFKKILSMGNSYLKYPKKIIPDATKIIKKGAKKVKEGAGIVKEKAEELYEQRDEIFDGGKKIFEKGRGIFDKFTD